MAHLTYSQKPGNQTDPQNYTAIWAQNISRDEYIAPIPEAERKDMVLAYHAQLNSVDEETHNKAAKAWAKWEYVLYSSRQLSYLNYLCIRMWTSKLYVDPVHIAHADDEKFAK